jgi:3-hydroxyacyl-[acyl-carrier-protein] dehydratase
MRWFWIDRFTEFVSGQYAVAIKAVSLGDEALEEYSPGRPFLPASLIIEGMAQAGGLLVSQRNDFKVRLVLAKISHSDFYFEACPGDTLTYRVELRSTGGNGAVVEGTSHLGDRLQAKGTLIFASLEDERFEDVQLFEPAGFCRMIRLLRLFDVGVNADGSPVNVPAHMIEAERADLLI